MKEEIKSKLKAANIKLTDGAIEVLEILESSNSPIDIIEVQSQMKSKVHIATIYRILEKLEEKKIINKLKFNEQKSFFELNKLPHDHFICTNCNKVIDKYLDKSKLSSAKNEVGKNYNVNVQNASINFTGICKDC